MTTLVFAHSWGGSSGEWAGVLPFFGGRFGIVAPDLPGFGGLPARVAAPTVADLADDLARLAEGLESYVLVGHSMGGKGAMAFAARRPAGLLRLVLLAPSPLSPEPMSDADRAAGLAGFGDRGYAEGAVARITGRALLPGSREEAVGDYLRTSPEAWRGWLEGGSREDLSPLYADVALPTLVLVGERDPVIAPGFARDEIVARLPDASLQVLAGVGHLSPREDPEAVARAILGFLGE